MPQASEKLDAGLAGFRQHQGTHDALKGKATIEGGAGGWWVDHTGHFSDVWQDAYYVNKTDFYFYTPVKAEITEWGEMKGAASIDNRRKPGRLYSGASWAKPHARRGSNPARSAPRRLSILGGPRFSP